MTVNTSQENMSAPPNGDPTSKEQQTAGWVRIPLPSRTSEETGWHYCSEETLISILGTQVLRATSIIAMNDSEEIAYGRRLAQEEVRRRKEASHTPDEGMRLLESVLERIEQVDRCHVFSICASAARDSLPMWRLYGESRPYAIELNLEQPMALKGVACEASASGLTGPFWHDVIYNPVEQADLIRSIFDWSLGFRRSIDDTFEKRVDFCADVVMCALALIKRPEFSYEREIRCFFIVDNAKYMGFRSTHYGLAPYIEVTGTTLENISHNRPASGPLPVTGIGVGPFDYRRTSFQSVRLLARKYGVPETNVWSSESSYR